MVAVGDSSSAVVAVHDTDGKRNMFASSSQMGSAMKLEAGEALLALSEYEMTSNS
jgi:hypothetical protein